MSTTYAAPAPINSGRLESLFRPRNIALVGASDKSNFSALAFGNLLSFGCADRTFLVNPRADTVHGTAAYPSCAAIDEQIDLAFMMVPQDRTLDALTEAAEAGVRNAVILSSGYAEAGPSGRAAQSDLVRHAQDLGMVLLGPNHLGFANFVDRIPVTPIPQLPQRTGTIALLSQSGASASAMVEFATSAQADLAHLITLGNEAMITAGHVLDYLVDNEATEAIAIFLETIRDPEVFAAAARRAAEKGKPVVVLKAGSSELAARTAAAHTGALVGDDRVIDAVFEDLGIIRVRSIEDMLVTAAAAAHMGPLSAPGLGIVSISGGACDIVADIAADTGLTIPEPSSHTLDQLKTILPDYGTAQNPLDITGAAVIDPSIFTRSIEALASDPAVGAVIAINTLPWLPSKEPFANQPLVDAVGAAHTEIPVAYVNQAALPITDSSLEVMDRAGVDFAICGLREATVALTAVSWWSQALENMRSQAPDPDARSIKLPSHPRRGSWPESLARETLIAAGIPVVPAEQVHSAEAAENAARLFARDVGQQGVGQRQASQRQAGQQGVGQREASQREAIQSVALKVVSPDIVHKSDVGGVRLSVPPAAAGEAYRQIRESVAAQAPRAKINGVLVSPMRDRGIELLVGVVRDPQWGPILALGLGGIFVEALDDSALTPLPVSEDKVVAMLQGLRGSAVLTGARGRTPANLQAVAKVIVAIGDLALALGPDLESLEVNPLRVEGSTVEALDAVLTWTEEATADEATADRTTEAQG